MLWLIDFDDTLAVGPFTWAFEHVIPRMIAKHNLPYDEALFNQAALDTQRQGGDNGEESGSIDGFLDEVGWDRSLKGELVEAIFHGYKPVLLPDAVAFLQRVKDASQTLFLFSNNNRAPLVTRYLGIDGYFSAMLTPALCGNLPGKPARDLFDHAIRAYAISSGEPVQVVGDDPWCDGAFADACNLDCWLVDRLKRYESLHAQHAYHWVSSLIEVNPPT